MCPPTTQPNPPLHTIPYTVPFPPTLASNPCTTPHPSPIHSTHTSTHHARPPHTYPTIPYPIHSIHQYVLVLEGRVVLKYGEVGEEIKEMEVAAGNGVFLPKGLRVKWVWPEPTKYVHTYTVLTGGE